MFKRVVLFSILFFIFSASPIFAQSVRERSIIVFKPGVSTTQRKTLINSYQGIWTKDLNLINGSTAYLSQTMIAKLTKDTNILRIEPDVIVKALDFQTGNNFPAYTRVSANSICDWFPSWPGCNPKPTTSPSIKPTPKPSATPTPKPTLQPSPSPSNIPVVSPSPQISPSPSTSAQIIPWGIAMINAPFAWNLSQGDGVKVGIIDTGINRNHPDLKDNLAGCVNFINPSSTCEDDNGHGTHVAGIIAAEDNNLGVVGVAPKARIYALKVLNSQGSGYLSDIIEALDWSINNGIQVINMSLGTSSNITSFHDAVTRAKNNGILEIAAAGNSGPYVNSVNYPAKYPEVMAVAAIDSSNNVPSWSSRGNEIDIAAPGVSIYSTYLSNGYKTLSGTSMAAPHVTGVAALRKQVKSAETVDQLFSDLVNNTQGLSQDKTLIGSGRVDAYQVVIAP